MPILRFVFLLFIVLVAVLALNRQRGIVDALEDAIAASDEIRACSRASVTDCKTLEKSAVSEAFRSGRFGRGPREAEIDAHYMLFFELANNSGRKCFLLRRYRDDGQPFVVIALEHDIACRDYRHLPGTYLLPPASLDLGRLSE